MREEGKDKIYCELREEVDQHQKPQKGVGDAIFLAEGEEQKRRQIGDEY